MPESEVEVLRREVAQLRTRLSELDQRGEADSARFLDALLLALPAVVLRFDADLKLRSVSRLAEGLTEAQVLGQPALNFIPPEDRPRAQAIIEETLRTGRTGFYQTTGPGPDGKPRRYDVFVAAIPEADGRAGGCFVALDISQLLEQQRALAASEQRLKFALEATGLGLWTWDMVTGEVFWDEQMKRLMGRPQALPLPDYVEKAVHPDDREAVRRGGENTFATGRFDTVAHRVLKPNGEVRWMITVGVIERDAAGKPLRLMGGNLDVTEQRTVEEQWRRGQKLEVVGRLTAGVAHNFNNMLMVMLPNLELLRSAVAATHRGLLDDAADAAARAADVVRKLMTFAGQRHAPSREPVDVGAMAARLVAMCERTFDRRIALKLAVSAADPWALSGAGDLEQVLMNLLVNARDAVEGPAVAEPRIEVTVFDAGPDERLPAAGRLLGLRVRDNGTGMTEQVKQHAFEPFFTDKAVGRGTGLGLPTSYAIVRDLGGRIDLDSAPGQGTTVTVLVPACDAPAWRVTDEAEKAPASAGGHEVLVVDDEALVRQAVRRILAGQGYRVREAADGASAIAELQQRPVDLVLLDRSMPGVPAAVLVPALRKAAPQAKVVLFTGGEVPAEERGAVDGVIEKPVRGEALLATLEGLLRDAAP